MDPGPTKVVRPCVFADTIPPPVPLLAMSPVEPKLAPLIATASPSTNTDFEYFFGESPLLPMFGKGVGTKGAGGPGILQTLGVVAAATPLLPLVTGVLGGFTLTLIVVALLGWKSSAG
nr:hypothetical protein [Pseudenhygromyxa sp. WMMC2535]